MKTKKFILPVLLLISLWASCNKVVYDDLLYPVCTLIYDDNESTAGSLPSEPVTYNPGDTLTILDNTGALQRTGYTFTGWNTEADGSGTTYTAGQAFTMGNNTVRLYALWDGNPYIITFDKNAIDAAGTMETQIIDCGQSAQLIENTYTRTGYTFIGWAVTAAGSLAYNGGSSYTMGAADVTLYALWSIDEYMITFNANGGVGGPMNPQVIIYNDTESIDANQFIRPGYTFYHWNTAADDSGTPYDDAANYTMGASGITLYAIWRGTVNFDANASDAAGSMTPQLIRYNTSQNLTSCGFTRTGYTFTGWNTKPLGTGTAYANNGSYLMNTGDVTLYAQWSANTYTLTFDANDGSGITSSQNIAYGVTTALNTNTFSRTGYTFSGWMTSSTGSIAQYQDKDLYTMGPGPSSLYALWEPLYRITYTVSGQSSGTVPVDSIEYKAGIIAYALKNTGNIKRHTVGDAAKFGGWTDGTNFYAEGDPITITGNITLHVNWVPFVIGDTGPAGGIIFYAKGYYSDGWRYIETSPAESLLPWNAEFDPHLTRYIYATPEFQNIGKGYENTNIIIS